MNRVGLIKLAAVTFLLLAGCNSHRPMATVDYVDLERFMGDWYVIANIPTFVEKGAHNPLESYRLDQDGTMATTFTFNADAFDGEKKTYRPAALSEIPKPMPSGGCSLSGQ